MDTFKIKIKGAEIELNFEEILDLELQLDAITELITHPRDEPIHHHFSTDDYDVNININIIPTFTTLKKSVNSSNVIPFRRKIK